HPSIAELVLLVVGDAADLRACGLGGGPPVRDDDLGTTHDKLVTHLARDERRDEGLAEAGHAAFGGCAARIQQPDMVLDGIGLEIAGLGSHARRSPSDSPCLSWWSA